MDERDLMLNRLRKSVEGLYGIAEERGLDYD
jgi:hypothetical protein